MKTLLLLSAAAALTACASEPSPTQDRGWIGGRFTDVSRDPVFWQPSTPETDAHRLVVGMPETVPGDRAALLDSSWDGTPVARAGLAAGDLVYEMDGQPVKGALDLRERVEALAPGAHSRVAYWRAGETRTADVVVGRETWRPAGRFTIALGLSLTLDLWPFDDGINVLDLVRVKWDRHRNDVTGPVATYRRQVDDDHTIEGPLQEATDVFVVLVGGAKGKTVLAQGEFGMPELP